MIPSLEQYMLKLNNMDQRMCQSRVDDREGVSFKLLDIARL